MTREDAFEIWLPIIKMGVKSMPECSEALDMAIKALKQEPCTDAISRQAAIDAFNAFADKVNQDTDIHEAIEIVLNLPSITPAEKVEQWIPVSEKLPEVGSKVLICYEFKKKRYIYIAVFHDDGLFYTFDYENLTKVIAWMPLPEPYKASPTGAESEGGTQHERP